MTEQRLTIRAELARRMGWTINEMRLGHFCLIAPDGSYRDCFHSEPEDVWECEWLPDPFTNAAASRELVVWLYTQNVGISSSFSEALWKALSLDHEDHRWDVVREIISAEPSVIARAACKALGIVEVE